jgi:hypothetical protein
MPFNYGMAILFGFTFGLALDNWILGLPLGIVMGFAFGNTGQKKEES